MSLMQHENISKSRSQFHIKKTEKLNIATFAFQLFQIASN